MSARFITTCLLLSGLLLASCAGGGTTTVAIVEHATTDAVTDLAPEGDSVGDLLTFANEVFDAANLNKVGTDSGWCIRTEVGKAWECFWTVYLADGQITVHGPFLDAGDSTLAITGGTGAFQGARGQMKLHARNPEGTEFDFVYEVMK